MMQIPTRANQDQTSAPPLRSLPGAAIIPSFSIGLGDAAQSLCAMPNVRRTLTLGLYLIAQTYSRAVCTSYGVAHWLKTNALQARNHPPSYRNPLTVVAFNAGLVKPVTVAAGDSRKFLG